MGPGALVPSSTVGGGSPPQLLGRDALRGGARLAMQNPDRLAAAALPVIGVLYGDILGTSARTSPFNPNVLDGHVSHSIRVQNLLNAVYLTASDPRFASAQIVIASDSLFAQFGSPLLAAEFAIGVWSYALHNGTMLRGAIEVGTVWNVNSDFEPPAGVTITSSPLMGWGLTAAAHAAEVGLKGVPGHRVALGRWLSSWLAKPDQLSGGANGDQGDLLRKLIAPPWAAEWSPHPQLLWMHEATLSGLVQNCTPGGQMPSLSKLHTKATESSPEAPEDQVGTAAWTASSGQVARYLQIKSTLP